MPKRFYAVAVGRVPGVYDTWAQAKNQVDAYPGAKYKGFETRQEAQDFVSHRTDSSILGQLGALVDVEPSETSVTSVEHVVSDAPCFNAQDIIAFTDGSAINNGRRNARAGYAVVFPNQTDLNKSGPLHGSMQTNNRAEYKALVECLDIVNKSIDTTGLRPLTVYTDSRLLLQSVTQWMKHWKKRGWTKANGEPVKNRDLLEEIEKNMQKRPIHLRFVKAHTGRDDWMSKWNDEADRLARAAALGGCVM